MSIQMLQVLGNMTLKDGAVQKYTYRRFNKSTSINKELKTGF